MKTFILVVVMFTNTQGRMETIQLEFTSQMKCEIAGQDMVDQFVLTDMGQRVFYSCNKK